MPKRKFRAVRPRRRLVSGKRVREILKDEGKMIHNLGDKRK